MTKLNIGAKLKKIREARKLTQVEFAELIGSSQATYQRIERGETNVDAEELFRYAEKLEVPIMDFFQDNITFHNHYEGDLGKIINYNTAPELEEQIKTIENEFLKEKIKLLEENKKLLEENNILLREIYNHKQADIKES